MEHPKAVPSLSRTRAAIVAVALLTSLLLTRNIDFGVYWYAIRGFASHTQPLYGPGSGVGFPMNYRYPPVTYILLWPLECLPLFWAGFIWMTGAWMTSIATLRLAIRSRHLHLRPAPIFAGYACMLAYAVLAIRSGNIQPYLIAMIFAAILIADTHPLSAAAMLALSITFKIWPAFFLPCFFRPERRAVLKWLVPAVVGLWLVPLAVWTPSQYVGLVNQWYAVEFGTATTNSELWYFPGQSLRSVLLRYMTTATPWLSGFPDLHFLCLPPAMAVRIWSVIAVVTYMVAFVAMARCDSRTQWVWDGIYFALFTILEPFCPKSSMISLGPAVFVAITLCSTCTLENHLPGSRRARRLFFVACVLAFLGAVLQYRPALRFVLAIGLDFYVSLLLLTSLLLWASRTSSGTRGSVSL